MDIPNESATVQQVASEGHFTKVAAGDQRAASLFARLVAYRLNPNGDPSGWGWLTKSPGETNVDGYAEDAIVFTNNPNDLNNVVDIVGGAGAPGATPGWNGPKERRPSNRWAAPRPLTTAELAYLGGSGGGDTGGGTGSTTWTSQHGAILMALAAKGIIDTKRIAEQFAFSFPSEGWGQKSVDPSRPISNDVIAQKSGSSFVGYRVVPASTSPAPINLTGQHFVAVQPRGHVEGVVIPPPTNPPVNQCPDPSRHTKPDCPDPAKHTGKPYPGDEPWDSIGETLLADMKKRGQKTLNPQSSRWIGRTIWRVVNEGMTLEQSTQQSQREWREVLGGEWNG